MSGKLTFRTIEQQLGLPGEERPRAASLEIWYESVRDRPISDFNIEDVCRACRQELYLEYLVPVAIKRLEADPLAGEKYHGELLVALNSVPRDFWAGHQYLARTAANILRAVDTDAHRDLADDVGRLLERLAGGMGS